MSVNDGYREKGVNHKTKIEWTHVPGYTGDTWNPFSGCTKPTLSQGGAGCAHCFAERMARRLKAMGLPLYQSAVDEKGNWTGTMSLSEDALLKPLKTKRPTCYFVGSMADMFHESRSQDDIFRVLDITKATPRHLFLLLTKRPQRMRRIIEDWQIGVNWGSRQENLWCGASVATQADADRTLPILAEVPCVVRYLSVEPMLGPIFFNPRSFQKIDWVIVGGESGPGARRMHPEWVQCVLDQCEAAKTPFFFKQWGTGWADLRGDLFNGREWKEFPKI